MSKEDIYLNAEAYQSLNNFRIKKIKEQIDIKIIKEDLHNILIKKELANVDKIFENVEGSQKLQVKIEYLKSLFESMDFVKNFLTDKNNQQNILEFFGKGEKNKSLDNFLYENTNQYDDKNFKDNLETFFMLFDDYNLVSFSAAALDLYPTRDRFLVPNPDYDEDQALAPGDEYTVPPEIPAGLGGKIDQLNDFLTDVTDEELKRELEADINIAALQTSLAAFFGIASKIGGPKAMQYSIAASTAVHFVILLYYFLRLKEHYTENKHHLIGFDLIDIALEIVALGGITPGSGEIVVATQLGRGLKAFLMSRPIIANYIVGGVEYIYLFLKQIPAKYKVVGGGMLAGYVLSDSDKLMGLVAVGGLLLGLKSTALEASQVTNAQIQKARMRLQDQGAGNQGILSKLRTYYDEGLIASDDAIKNNIETASKLSETSLASSIRQVVNERIKMEQDAAEAANLMKDMKSLFTESRKWLEANKNLLKVFYENVYKNHTNPGVTIASFDAAFELLISLMKRYENEVASEIMAGTFTKEKAINHHKSLFGEGYVVPDSYISKYPVHAAYIEMVATSDPSNILLKEEVEGLCELLADVGNNPGKWGLALSEFGKYVEKFTGEKLSRFDKGPQNIFGVIEDALGTVTLTKSDFGKQVFLDLYKELFPQSPIPNMKTLEVKTTGDMANNNLEFVSAEWTVTKTTQAGVAKQSTEKVVFNDSKVSPQIFNTFKSDFVEKMSLHKEHLKSSQAAQQLQKIPNETDQKILSTMLFAGKNSPGETALAKWSGSSSSAKLDNLLPSFKGDKIKDNIATYRGNLAQGAQDQNKALDEVIELLITRHKSTPNQNPSIEEKYKRLLANDSRTPEETALMKRIEELAEMNAEKSKAYDVTWTGPGGSPKTYKATDMFNLAGDLLKAGNPPGTWILLPQNKGSLDFVTEILKESLKTAKITVRAKVLLQNMNDIAVRLSRKSVIIKGESYSFDLMKEVKRPDVQKLMYAYALQNSIMTWVRKTSASLFAGAREATATGFQKVFGQVMGAVLGIPGYVFDNYLIPKTLHLSSGLIQTHLSLGLLKIARTSARGIESQISEAIDKVKPN